MSDCKHGVPLYEHCEECSPPPADLHREAMPDDREEELLTDERANAEIRAVCLLRGACRDREVDPQDRQRPSQLLRPLRAVENRPTIGDERMALPSSDALTRVVEDALRYGMGVTRIEPMSFWRDPDAGEHPFGDTFFWNTREYDDGSGPVAAAARFWRVNIQ